MLICFKKQKVFIKNFPNLNNINNDIKSAKSYSFPLHYESGIGVLSQKYKEKEFIYGIDIKNNKEIWRKSINDSYLSDPFIWNHLLINISNFLKLMNFEDKKKSVINKNDEIIKATLVCSAGKNLIK